MAAINPTTEVFEIVNETCNSMKTTIIRMLSYDVLIAERIKLARVTTFVESTELGISTTSATCVVNLLHISALALVIFAHITMIVLRKVSS